MVISLYANYQDYAAHEDGMPYRSDDADDGERTYPVIAYGDDGKLVAD